MGEISNNELTDYFRKKSNTFLNSREGKYYTYENPLKTATTEEIDDWCLHVDSVLYDYSKKTQKSLASVMNLTFLTLIF